MRKRNWQARKRSRGYKSPNSFALIVSDKSKHGERIALDIYKILEKADLEGTIFPGADPNPTDTSVMEGVDIYRSERYYSRPVSNPD